MQTGKDCTEEAMFKQIAKDEQEFTSEGTKVSVRRAHSQKWTRAQSKLVTDGARL